MMEKNDYLFTAPDLVPEKLGRRLERRAPPFGGISQIEASAAQGVIDELRISALFEDIPKQIARISILSFHDHEPRGKLLVKQDLCFVRLWILQMPVASVNVEQKPCVDRGIQVDQRGDSGLDMDRACPPERLQLNDCHSALRDGENTNRE